MQDQINSLESKMEALSLKVDDQANMIASDLQISLEPLVQKMVEKRVQSVLASETLKIALKPNYLKEHYAGMGTDDKDRYLEDVSVVYSEVEEILQICPKIRDRIFNIKGVWKNMQDADVKLSCSSTELVNSNYNKLEKAMKMLPKIVERKEEGGENQTGAQQERQRPDYRPQVYSNFNSKRQRYY